MSTCGVPSSRGLALENFTVQRASRSFCRSLAGFFIQHAGVSPCLIAARSASVLRYFGAVTIVASMICPPMAT